ncbi:conserved hypothetical protein [Roseibium sp. TrichSKD4]|nr:conserved hypothetical protein [Roseibium sp. TrichSKD4]
MSDASGSAACRYHQSDIRSYYRAFYSIIDCMIHVQILHLQLKSEISIIAIPIQYPRAGLKSKADPN